MTKEYKKHLEEILGLANELRETHKHVYDKIREYSKQFADLKIGFVKSLAEEKLSLEEAQKVNLALTTTSDALLDYLRYRFAEDKKELD